MNSRHQEIVEFIAAAREAGAVFVEFDGLKVQLVPKNEPITFGDGKQYVKPEPKDPLKDPATYGLADNDALPGSDLTRRSRPDTSDDDFADEGDE